MVQSKASKFSGYCNNNLLLHFQKTFRPASTANLDDWGGVVIIDQNYLPPLQT